jgi:CheY-like chemotaxis protein/HPt (histidine-containing phosphotransfer) domain-containing protein
MPRRDATNGDEAGANGAASRNDRFGMDVIEAQDNLDELGETPLPSPPRGSVLVVEDNAVNQRVIELQLRKLGLASLIVGNGIAALGVLADRRFDLVFMDCQMPEMDGYETTMEMRRREKTTGVHTPVIAMTAHAMDGDREKCFAAGMDDYLSKPVRLDVLAETIERWLVARPDANAATPAAPPRTAPDEMFDADHLREICDGDRNVMRDLVLLFVTQTRGRFEQLIKAAEAGDMAAIQRIAHTARGSSSMMGVNGLVGSFRDIETNAIDTEKPGLSALIQVANERFEQACARLVSEGLLDAPAVTKAE